MALLPASLRRLASKAFSLAEKEASVLKLLHEDAKAAVRRMGESDPGLRQLLDKAHAYAVFPSVGKATAVVGGAFGKGEVFQGGQLIGYAGLLQLTLGVQLGGQTFSEIVAFENKAALDRFKAGRTAFAANASAVLVKAGAAATSNYTSGAAVFVSSEGGMMLEAAIGAQKFIFKPAALGRLKDAPNPGGAGAAPGGKKTGPRQPSPAKKDSRPAARRAKPQGAAGKPRNAARKQRGAAGKLPGTAGKPGSATSKSRGAAGKSAGSTTRPRGTPASRGRGRGQE